MSFPKLDQKKSELNAKTDELAGIFKDAKTDSGDYDHDTLKNRLNVTNSKEVAEAIQERNEEINALSDEVKDLEAINLGATNALRGDDGARMEPGGGEPKGAQEAFIKRLYQSDALRVKGTTAQIDLPDAPQMRPAREVLNTLFQTTDGWAPESTRSGLVTLSPQEEPAVTDLVPLIQWSQELFKYMEETIFTNAATEAGEGTLYPEAALKVEEQSEEIRKLPVWLPLTDEQLDDVPGARAYTESRLRFMLDQKLDQRILTGDPAAATPQIKGFHNVTGINSQARGTDPIPDAIHKGATLIRTQGQAQPEAVVFEPTDWQKVRLLRTSDGMYIWGSPADAGPARIWGMPVVQSTHQTAGQALVGAFRAHSLLAMRRGIDVQVSNSHSDFFTNGKQAMRADTRVALVTVRPPAFTEVTGL